jgi:ParB family chromosome partitioning protein
MAKKRPGLGKGLGALIPDVEESAQAMSGSIAVPVEKIIPNPHQPRANFEPEGIAELAASIREHGIIQPLIVTRDEEADNYTLIAGERRLMAAKEAELDEVPVILRDASDQDRLELALIENVQRADLSPLETATAYQQLVDEFDLSHGEIAERVGKSRASITNTLRLLSLPPSIKEALVEEKISEGHARALLGLPTTQSQAAALQTVIDKGLNVRQTEALVRKLSGEKPAPKPKPAPSPEVIEIEDQLQASLGTKVKLKHGKKGGTITIHYYSNEELDALIEKLS